MQEFNNYEIVLPDKLIILDHVPIKGFTYIYQMVHAKILFIMEIT